MEFTGGRLAFETYAAAMRDRGQAFSLKWEDLDDNIHNAWEVTVTTIRDEILNEIIDGKIHFIYGVGGSSSAGGGGGGGGNVTVAKAPDPAS